MKLRELETLRSFREMQDAVTELNQRWQVRQPPASRPERGPWSASRSAARRSLASAAPHVPRQQHGRRRRPLEGIPEEERHERAAGQADDGQAEGGRGSGRAARGQTQRPAAGEPGENFIKSASPLSGGTSLCWRTRFCSSHFCVRIFTFVLYSDFYIFYSLKFCIS